MDHLAADGVQAPDGLTEAGLASEQPAACQRYDDSTFPFPVRMPSELMAGLIHSADERIPVDDVELGLDWLRHAARTVCA